MTAHKSTVVCLMIGLSLLLNGIAKAQLHIIPQPYTIKERKGGFFLKEGSTIGVDRKSKTIGLYLQQYLLQTYHLQFKVKTYENIPLNVPVRLTSNQDTIKGAYSLNVKLRSITISGKEEGLFYGVQSLLQLLPEPKDGSFYLPACAIADHPRFNWRGLSLDVCRHFFTVDEVKKYIDIMAHYKLNVFHWHLTDDEGWRIQIDKYPRLTQVAANMSYWAQQGKFRKLDNIVAGGREGFYTKEEIRSVVKYAKDRFITILPEIEMPGHSEAAIFAYPELGCKDTTGTRTRIRILDPGEKTFTFLQDVLTEVIDLFPGRYIHIGGDEAEMADWLNSPTAVAVMKKENLKTVKDLQSYFIRRIERFLLTKNKKLVGWDEILQGGLAPSATVMSWQGEKGGIAAAKMHHPVVMTPLPYLYFDAPQASAETEPLGWNDPVSWQMVYNYEPVSPELSPAEARYILGTQANIWVEKIPSMKQVEYMVYPRALALSELAWSKPENKNIVRFEKKMYRQYNLFKRWHLNARVPGAAGIMDITTNKSVIHLNITHPLKNAAFRYEMNRKPPAGSSTGFPVAISLPLKDSLQFKGFTTIKNNDQQILQIARFKQVNVNRTQEKLSEIQEDLFFNNSANDETSFSGYLNIPKEDDYNISSDFETSPSLSLGEANIIHKNKNKYTDPQAAILHLTPGYYELKGVFVTQPGNTHDQLIRVKTSKGNLLDLSHHLVHVSLTQKNESDQK